MPECNLVCCQHRPLKILLQGLNCADSAETITTYEDGLRVLRGMGTDPLIELAGMNGALVRWQPGRAVVDDIEFVSLEVIGSLAAQLCGEPRRIDHCKSFDTKHSQSQGCCCTGDHDRYAPVRSSNRLFNAASSAAPRT